MNSGQSIPACISDLSHRISIFFVCRLLLLDDDDTAQPHLVLTALWRAWQDSLRGSVRGVGIPVGVKAINPPVRGAQSVVPVNLSAYVLN